MPPAAPVHSNTSTHISDACPCQLHILSILVTQRVYSTENDSADSRESVPYRVRHFLISSGIGELPH